MRYSVISFDLDGTLVETGGEIAAAVNRTLAEFGLPRQSDALIIGFVGAGTHTTLQRVLAHLREQGGHRIDARCAAAMLPRLDEHYGALAGSLAKPFPGCVATLRALHMGGVKLACLTNKEQRFALKVLAGAGLLDSFDLVAGGDTLPQPKPHPQALLHVLEALGAQPGQAAHIGDSATDIDTALAAGAEAWFVPWGYPGPSGATGHAAQRAQRCFNSLPEVAEFVLSANRERRHPATA